MDKATEDILDALDFIKERMATKSDIAELRLEGHAARNEAQIEFRSIRTELATLMRRLDLIDEQYKQLRGVTREIDDVRERVRDIERHLGMEKKIAA